LIVFEKPFKKVRQGQATPTESEWVTPHTPSIEVFVSDLVPPPFLKSVFYCFSLLLTLH